MNLIIGSKYHVNLSLLVHLLKSVRNDIPQENPELLLVHSQQGEERGRCYYDKCSHKEEPADARIILIYETPRQEESLKYSGGRLVYSQIGFNTLQLAAPIWELEIAGREAKKFAKYPISLLWG